ncbi:MAG TPA: polyprenyl diphosphate synthase [Candidatus Saccharimonadales bacterium]|nr:polyprenyl diphosphate synthase [Candidatus Saccharimonadales bacterium]
MTAKAHPLNHLAIIPDGNTRWANANGKSPYEGYKLGLKRGVELARHARERGIHTLTLWGLSTENWQHRSARELAFLVRIFDKAIDDYIEEAQQDGMRIIHIGNKNRLPKKLMKKLQWAEEATKSNVNHILNLALDYGGHDEILRATHRIIQAVKDGKIGAESFAQGNGDDPKSAEKTYEEYLDTAGQPYPYPDLIVRTAGDQRLSGFMLWQAAYAELYFVDVYFPDFDPAHLDVAIEAYDKRQRRFGATH